MMNQGAKPLGDIFSREVRREEVEKLSVQDLIDAGDERVIEVIENECFPVQTYGELQPERRFLVEKFSESVSAERKKKLKQILYQHERSEMIGRLERAGFSFEGTCS